MGNREIDFTGLTPRQLELFHFLVDRIEADGYAPTVAEICSALGVKSNNTVSQMLLCLEQRGKIVRLPAKARGIRLVYSSGDPLAAQISTVLNQCVLSPETRGELSRIRETLEA